MSNTVADNREYTADDWKAEVKRIKNVAVIVLILCVLVRILGWLAPQDQIKQ